MEINPTKVHPCGHRLLVRVKKPTEKTQGGIIIPDKTLKHEQSSYSYGTVVEKGKTAFQDVGDGHSWCEVGDEVLFVKHAGTALSEEYIGEQEFMYRVINDLDVYAVVRK